MVLIVNLLEVSVLTTSLFLFVDRLRNFCHISLVANKVRIFAQIEISVVIVRLNRLRWELLGEELELGHLVLVQALRVAIVRIGVRQRLNWSVLEVAGRSGP